MISNVQLQEKYSGPKKKKKNLKLWSKIVCGVSISATQKKGKKSNLTIRVNMQIRM